MRRFWVKIGGKSGFSACSRMRLLSRKKRLRWPPPDHRHHDVAVVGILLASNDGNVAIENTGVAHAVAAHAQREVGARPEQLVGYRDGPFDVFVGKHRQAGGDPPEQRDAHQAVLALSGAVVEYFQGARAALAGAYVAPFFGAP